MLHIFFDSGFVRLCQFVVLFGWNMDVCLQRRTLKLSDVHAKLFVAIIFQNSINISLSRAM